MAGITCMIDNFTKKHESRIKDAKYTLHLFRHSILSMVGLAIIITVILVAIFAPMLAKEHPTYVEVTTEQGTIRTEERWTHHFEDKLLPPGGKHYFGTDDYGHDIYSMVVYASRISLKISLLVVISATIIGTVLGGVAGYFGGIVDEVIMRITDIFLSIPGLILAMAVVAALGRSLEHIMYALIIVWWPAYTRLMRGQVLSIRENQYVEAARSVGSNSTRIIFKHILPNAMSPLWVQMSRDLGTVMLVAAGLSFIGLGASPGTAEWGLMVSMGRTHMLHAWWYVTFPGLAIFFTVLGFNLLGDGIRDVTDPRLRR